MRPRPRELAVLPLLVYQRVISPLIPPRCRYEPSCSHYAVQAIREFGILRGLVLAGWRVCVATRSAAGASIRCRRSICSTRTTAAAEAAGSRQ